MDKTKQLLSEADIIIQIGYLWNNEINAKASTPFFTIKSIGLKLQFQIIDG